MKKKRVTASKKTKTITKLKTVIHHSENLPIFPAGSNVMEENINLSITMNIKDLLARLIQQIRAIRDFPNIRTKYIGPK